VLSTRRTGRYHILHTFSQGIVESRTSGPGADGRNLERGQPFHVKPRNVPHWLMKRSLDQASEASASRPRWTTEKLLKNHPHLYSASCNLNGRLRWVNQSLLPLHERLMPSYSSYLLTLSCYAVERSQGW
jgi:hypothetical protein